MLNKGNLKNLFICETIVLILIYTINPCFIFNTLYSQFEFETSSQIQDFISRDKLKIMI